MLTHVTAVKISSQLDASVTTMELASLRTQAERGPWLIGQALSLLAAKGELFRSTASVKGTAFIAHRSTVPFHRLQKVQK